jgi:hypothetical protein
MSLRSNQLSVVSCQFSVLRPRVTVPFCRSSLPLLRARGGTGILPVRTAKMAVPRLGLVRGRLLCREDFFSVFSVAKKRPNTEGAETL